MFQDKTFNWGGGGGGGTDIKEYIIYFDLGRLSHVPRKNQINALEEN